MCEARIEKALDVPGVIMAEWDVETKKATVAYKTKVISEEQIHQLTPTVVMRPPMKRTRTCTDAANTVKEVVLHR